MPCTILMPGALAASTSPTWRGNTSYRFMSSWMLASALGPNEDFDGLVTELGDIADSGEFDGFDA